MVVTGAAYGIDAATGDTTLREYAVVAITRRGGTQTERYLRS